MSEVTASSAPGSARETEKPVMIQFIGLQRSGNHAISLWIESLFRSAHHINNRSHDFFGNPERARAMLEEGGNWRCAVVSFEDTKASLKTNKRMLDNVIPARPEDFPAYDCRTRIVLRDPFNCWASRLASNESGKKLTSLNELEYFIANWLDIAAAHEADPETVVVYNLWHKSRPYREAACRSLGGTYSEATLDHVPGFGQGSSFVGASARPSYGMIVKRLPHYFSRRFLKRFADAPLDYARRLFSKRIGAEALGDVEARWKTIIGREDCRELFEHPEIRRQSLRIFGWSAAPDGSVIRR